ncbi:MAG TPA: hypothetical protein VN493_19585 [Thermoanaerobaculia bacterium]|nr:hypothetical protein [Thermoanaerobaculia bacterium]
MRPAPSIRERVLSPFHAAEPPAPKRAGAAGLPPELALREMTGYEEEVLEARLEDSNTAALCNEILARCLVPPGRDPAAARETVRALPVARRDALLIELRRRSLGSAISTRVPCPRCAEVNEVEFDLGELRIETADAEIPDTVECPLGDGRLAGLRLPNAGDQADLLDAGLSSMAERRTWLLARVLLRLGDEQGPFPEDAVRALPMRVRRALEEALEAAVPDLDLGLAVRCHACGHAFGAPFDAAGFFLSSGGDGW